MDNAAVLPPFTVTEAAIAKIEQLGGIVNLDVIAGGCSGQAFRFSAGGTNDGGPAWDTFGCPGAWLRVQTNLVETLRGSTLDYSDTIRPPRFRVLRNPNPIILCPCKRSFGNAWPGPGSPHCRSYLPMPWDTGFDPPARWKRQTGYES